MHSFPIQGERQHGKAEAAATAERSDRSQLERDERRGSFHTLPPSSSPPPVRRTPSYGALGTTTLSEEIKQTEDRYSTAEEGEALLGNDMKSNSRDSDTQKREDGRAGFAEDLLGVEDFKPSKMRFVVAGVLFISCALNCYIEYTFVAIWSIAIDAYQVGPLEINALALVFALFYVPGSIIAIGLYARYGLSSCINGSTLLNFMSCWVRFIGSALFLKSSPNVAYSIVLFGHCLAALGAPMIGNAPTRLANDWFPEHERDLAVSIMTQAFSVGGGFGALFPVYEVTKVTDIPNMLFWQAVFSTVLLMFSVVWVPYYPPAHSGLDAAYQAILRTETKGSGLRDLLGQMMTDFSDMTADLSFVVLLIAFSLEVGVSWALASLVGQLVQPCGYSNTVIGILSIGTGFSGVFGSFGTASVLRAWPQSYLTMQKFMLVFTALAALWCLAVNRPGHFGQLLVPWVIYGLASGPLVPVTLGLAAEMTYPIPADNSAALLFTGAITVFFFATIVLTALLRLEVSTSCSNLVTPASVLLTMLVLVGAGIALPMQIGPMQRLELLRESEKADPKTSDAPPVNAQAIGPGVGGKKSTSKSELGRIIEDAEYEDDSIKSSNHGRNGKHVDEDDDEYRMRRASSIFGKYYHSNHDHDSPTSATASAMTTGMKSDSDREFDIGPLVDRELHSPGWIRKKQKPGGQG